MKNIILTFFVLISSGCASSNYYYQNGEQKKLTKVKTRALSNLDYYKTENGQKLGVDNTLLVKFHNLKNINTYLKEFDMVLVEELSENLYKLKVTDKSLTIDTANALYNKDDIKYAHPNFYRKREQR